MKARRDCAKSVLGWLVICGWQALVASSAYLSGTMILTLVTMNRPEYSATQWQSTLLYWAIMGMAILVNRFSTTSLPVVQIFILALHIFGFFAFLIPMVSVRCSRRLIHVYEPRLRQAEESEEVNLD